MFLLHLPRHRPPEIRHVSTRNHYRIPNVGSRIWNRNRKRDRGLSALESYPNSVVRQSSAGYFVVPLFNI